MQLIQAAAATGGSKSSGTSMNKSLNAAVLGEAIPRGRGVDERAARAAAVVRKKAAAKGRLTRPNAAPVEPVTQLLNIISSGMASSKDGEEADKNRNETVKSPPPPAGGPNDLTGNASQGEQETQTAAPVGLGKGLASLDPKKSKTKAKASGSES